MNKKVLLIILIIVSIICVTGCQVKSGNRILTGLDVQTFNYAYVIIGDKTIAEGYVTQWRDYDDSEAVQVLIDGKYYLTEYTNVVLIADPSIGSLQYDDVSSGAAVINKNE